MMPANVVVGGRTGMCGRRDGRAVRKLLEDEVSSS